MTIRLSGLVALVSSLALLLPPEAQAQPYSELRITAAGAYNVNRNVFHRYWREGRGGELAFATPFHFGELEAGAALHHYGARSDVPQFTALLAFAGWGISVAPAQSISWYNGVRLGNYRMSFDEDTFPGVKNESEVAVGFHSQIAYRVSRFLSVSISAQYNEALTSVKFRTVYLGAGLNAHLEMPGWLRSFLR